MIGESGGLAGPALGARLDALGAFLVAHHELWHPRAFYGMPLPWEARCPELAAWIDDQPVRLGSEGVDDPLAWAATGPESLQTIARDAAALSAVPSLEAASAEVPSRRVLDAISGKKQAQILALAGVALAHVPGVRGGRLLDWCGGKAHLGRLLAGLAGAELSVLEHDEALCRAGARLARAKGVSATFYTADALGPEAAALAASGASAVALHACGDLHGALIEHHRGPGLAIAPCCFVRAMDSNGNARVLSARGRAAGLSLDGHDLRLVHETPSDAGARDAAQVDRVQAYRLGYDAWLRVAQGRPEGPDGYTPIEACPPQWYGLDFVSFCQRFAEHAGHEAPGPSVAGFEIEGARRFEAVRRRDRLRAVFRRALEVWLVLDRAARLEERGYAVTVGTFCCERVTPRNLLLLARGHG